MNWKLRKRTVHKFVAQNDERQREIVRLKTELAKLIDLHTQEVHMKRTLEDKVMVNIECHHQRKKTEIRS